MKIYTKTGDQGETGLFGGPRVSKDDLRIEAYGTVDELNAALGVARAAGQPPAIDSIVERLQHELFAVGAELATPDASARGLRLIGGVQIEALERDIDAHEATLPPLRQFILPAGSPAAAALHYARTVCRRAERRVVTLTRAPVVPPAEPIGEEVVSYLNRVGDLLFVLARAANQTAGVADSPWRR